jgi:putative phosphoribosyl transferase
MNADRRSEHGTGRALPGPAPLPYPDRASAGRDLARALSERLGSLVPGAPGAEPVVLALPRGGVPVAAEVARRLQAPLDLLLVRKIGVRWQPELALAAVVEGDPPVLVVDEPVQAAAQATPDELEHGMQQALAEIRRRRALYLADRAPVPLAGRTAVLVDDGIATGTTVRAALQGLRRRQDAPAHVVLAVPVAPAETLERLAREVDAVVCLHQPQPFHAVGVHYRDFHQLGDDEVMAALRQANAHAAASNAVQRAV